MFATRRIITFALRGSSVNCGMVPQYVKRSDILIPSVSFSRIRKKKPVATVTDNELSVAPPPPAPVSVEEAWVEVRDKASGQMYWWNTVTNETTSLGAPRPAGPTSLAHAQPQQQSGGGLGQVVAEGFAFGAGSAVAHRMVGSLFGGGGGGHSNDSGSDGGFDGGSDSSFDI